MDWVMNWVLDSYIWHTVFLVPSACSMCQLLAYAYCKLEAERLEDRVRGGWDLLFIVEWLEQDFSLSGVNLGWTYRLNEDPGSVLNCPLNMAKQASSNMNKTELHKTLWWSNGEQTHTGREVVSFRDHWPAARERVCMVTTSCLTFVWDRTKMPEVMLLQTTVWGVRVNIMNQARDLVRDSWIGTLRKSNRAQQSPFWQHMLACR